MLNICRLKSIENIGGNPRIDNRHATNGLLDKAIKRYKQW
jgi:hypothetical protein